jgi:protein-disulfide isomerase
LKALEEKYGKDLRIAFKHNPLGFHPNAMPAANGAECAREQGKFWQMHDKMFENQRDLAKERIEQYAKEAGLDFGRWKGCFDAEKYKDRILGDQRMAMQLGARGTPAFFINGRFLSGAQPQPAFEALIDEELKKAKDSGMSRKEYYEKAIVEKGKKAM